VGREGREAREAREAADYAQGYTTGKQSEVREAADYAADYAQGYTTGKQSEVREARKARELSSTSASKHALHKYLITRTLLTLSVCSSDRLAKCLSNQSLQ
jgi:hypothetical protein